MEKKIILSKRKFEEVIKQTSTLRSALPKLLKPELLYLPKQIEKTQKELCVVKKDLETAKLDVHHWQARYKNCLGDYTQQKEKNVQLLQENQHLSDQLAQQSQFCSQLGASLGTILWRVSRDENTIPAMLVGTKTEEFLKLIAVTLESFASTFKDELPSEQCEESQFVQALCGIITNIAASPTGREFLMACDPGKQVVDVMMTFLSNAPNTKASACVKKLLLMAMYNLSINYKGLEYIGAKQGTVGLLVWLIQEQKEPENRLHALRLIQSLVCNNEHETILNEAREVMTLDFLQNLSQDKNKELQTAAGELIKELNFLFVEQ